jgi:hypothetical protein
MQLFQSVIPEISITHKETLYLLAVTIHSLLPQLLITINLVCVSMGLPILDIFYEWSYHLWPMCLVSFTLLGVSRVHLYCVIYAVLYMSASFPFKED